MGIVTVVFLAIGVVVIAGILALGVWYPGTGADQLGWRSSRSHAEAEIASDAEDLEQLLEVTNRRRRARGEDELTVEGLAAEQQDAAERAVAARRAARARAKAQAQSPPPTRGGGPGGGAVGSRPMARVLIVGCGCRGQALARELRREGHAVRGTTRTEARREAIEAAGAEVWIGDPDRIASIHYALDGVTILCWLMGSASGSDEQLAALHGSRLRMLLERTIDTTVRGVVYESAGSVDAGLLAAGAAEVQRACDFSEIPHGLLARDPADGHDAWLAAARDAVDGLLAYQRA